jgi:DNA-binding NarL/FixJ family response regulator
MPRLDGLEATRRITARHPQIRVVMLTMNEDDETVLAAIRGGASGYLLKGSGAEEVHHAVRAAAAGGMVFGSALAGRIAAYFSGAATRAEAPEPFPELTEREREEQDLVARGYDNRRIARELFLSDKTVRNHVSNVLTKLDVETRAEAVVRARNAGLGG